jgi:hypothetical protein
MAELMNAVASGNEPTNNGVDNLKTMAAIEAGYLSLKEHRAVAVAEVMPAENAS